MLRIFFLFIVYFFSNPIIFLGNEIKSLDVTEIAEGVYVHYGKHENFYEKEDNIAKYGTISSDNNSLYNMYNFLDIVLQ